MYTRYILPSRLLSADNITRIFSFFFPCFLSTGGAIPYCGATPADKKYNIRYIYPQGKGGLTQMQIAIIVGAVGGGVVLLALLAGVQLWYRYKRTTQRMAKFSSLSRGLPDALLDGEGQEVAV